jgi:hypothetical protein
MQKITKKQVITLVIAIIIIAGLTYGILKVLEVQPDQPVTEKETIRNNQREIVGQKEIKEEDKKNQEKIGMVDEFELAIIDEIVFLDGEIVSVNIEEEYLVVNLVWVDPRMTRIISVGEEIKINVVPGKTQLSYMKMIEEDAVPPKEVPVPPEDIGLPPEDIDLLNELAPEIGLKDLNLNIGGMVHVEGKWNAEKNILEPLSIMFVITE